MMEDARIKCFMLQKNCFVTNSSLMNHKNFYESSSRLKKQGDKNFDGRSF